MFYTVSPIFRQPLLRHVLQSKWTSNLPARASESCQSMSFAGGRRDRKQWWLFLSGFFSSIPSVSRQLQILSITMLFAAYTCVAQQGIPTAEPPDRTGPQESTSPGSQRTTITIPAGTHLALALTHPVDSHSARRGDEIFAQTTSPLIVSNQVAIPAGTFVQGKVDKMTRRGTRGELLMQSVSVVFPNGYVATIKGPSSMESDEGTAWSNPSSAEKAGIFAAPLAGLGIGAAIGAAQHTTQSSTLGGTTLTSSTPKG